MERTSTLIPHTNQNNNTFCSCLRPSCREDRISKKRGSLKSRTFKLMLFDDDEEEEVVVNLFDGFADIKHDAKISSPGYRTPPEYRRTIDWYYHFRESRLRCITVIKLSGELLLKDQVEGDREDWEQHLEQSREDVSQWRRRCLESDRERAKEWRGKEKPQSRGKKKPQQNTGEEMPQNNYCEFVEKFINRIWSRPK